jgi:hypothetical protein
MFASEIKRQRSLASDNSYPAFQVWIEPAATYLLSVRLQDSGPDSQSVCDFPKLTFRKPTLRIFTGTCVTADVAPELRVHLHGAKAIKVGRFMRSEEKSLRFEDNHHLRQG